MLAGARDLYMESKTFLDNSCFLNKKKFIKSFSEIKNKINLTCLLYRNVANDVLFQRHFTDLDYLDWFSRCK